MTQRIKVGTINVDAGLCWIGDPCYILHKTSGELAAKGLGADWKGFCSVLRDAGYMEADIAVHEFDDGCVVETGYGDGCYPVFAEIQNGRVARVIVEFIGADNSEED